MKKILSLVLCIVMIASTLVMLAGCGVDNTKGAIIPIYVSKMPSNFDPAFCLNDASGIALTNLLFEGLMKYDSEGKVINGLATDYKYYTEDGAKKLDVYIDKNANWSDGTAVSANDFIFAWTRLLDPWNSFEAASMLFHIKNAKAYKNGTGTTSSSPSDLGFIANGKNNKTLTIEFEDDVDEALFLEYLASPALVPIPERKAKALMSNRSLDYSYDWTTHVVTMESNGPFKVKSFAIGETLVLERNANYFRNAEKSKKLSEQVTPYRLIITYRNVADTTQSATDFNFELYNNGDVLYNSYLPLDQRNNLTGVKHRDTLTTFSLLFNTLPLSEILGDEELDSEAGIVANKKVRQALSLVLDRNKIAEKIVYATPATGIVPDGVFNTSSKNSFRKVGGDLISTSADVEKAKQLLKESGITGGDITVAVRATDELAIELLKEIKSTWEGLTWSGKKEGIKVKILELGTMSYTNLEKAYEGLTLDLFTEAYKNGASAKYKVDSETKALSITGYEKIDIYALDLQALSSDAFSTLAPFAKAYSGGGRAPIEEITDEDFPPVPHRSGYDNAAYEELIDKAFSTIKRADRAEFLHQAEEVLVDDMVVAPLFVYKNAYLVSSELKKISFDYFGMANFSKTQYKNYVEVDEAAE